jgi:hypothetical protein
LALPLLQVTIFSLIQRPLTSDRYHTEGITVAPDPQPGDVGPPAASTTSGQDSVMESLPRDGSARQDTNELESNPPTANGDSHKSDRENGSASNVTSNDQVDPETMKKAYEDYRKQVIL